MKKDLFDDIIRELPDCQYISDLRMFMNTGRLSDLKSVLMSIDYQDYSVTQWNELIKYLFDENQTCESHKEAYYRILESLNKALTTL